jgi:hypothetical protein
MAFENVPWALDGALIPASLARLGQYVATSGAEGIAQLGDLKVAPLDTPGNGIKIFSGGAVVLNRYQGENPDQSYMVYSPNGEILGPGDMPASSGSAKSHLVCVTVGDPEFSQAGHPWMLGTDPPAGTENTFEYVRPFVIQNVPAGTTSFDELNFNYPAYALARLDIPASTTTITSGLIHDLRKMAQPRSSEEMWHVDVSTNDVLTTAANGTFEYWPDNSQKAIYIPKWASYVHTQGFIEGYKQLAYDLGAVNISVRIGAFGPGLAGAVSHSNSTVLSTQVSGGFARKGINLGGEIYIPAVYRGTTQNFQIQATPLDTGSQGRLTTDSWTSALVRLRFIEVPD